MQTNPINHPKQLQQMQMLTWWKATKSKSTKSTLLGLANTNISNQQKMMPSWNGPSSIFRSELDRLRVRDNRILHANVYRHDGASEQFKHEMVVQLEDKLQDSTVGNAHDDVNVDASIPSSSTEIGTTCCVANVDLPVQGHLLLSLS